MLNIVQYVKYSQLSYTLLKVEKFTNCQLSVEVKRRLYFETLKYHSYILSQNLFLCLNHLDRRTADK